LYWDVVAQNLLETGALFGYLSGTLAGLSAEHMEVPSQGDQVRQTITYGRNKTLGWACSRLSKF
jgi:hypothetical protein